MLWKGYYKQRLVSFVYRCSHLLILKSNLKSKTFYRFLHIYCKVIWKIFEYFKWVRPPPLTVCMCYILYLLLSWLNVLLFLNMYKCMFDIYIYFLSLWRKGTISKTRGTVLQADILVSVLFFIVKYFWCSEVMEIKKSEHHIFIFYITNNFYSISVWAARLCESVKYPH